MSSFEYDRHCLSCNVDIDIVTSDKFARLFTVRFILQHELPHGFALDIDASIMDRPYASDVAPKSLACTHHSWRKDFIGAYVTHVMIKFSTMLLISPVLWRLLSLLILNSP